MTFVPFGTTRGTTLIPLLTLLLAASLRADDDDAAGEWAANPFEDAIQQVEYAETSLPDTRPAVPGYQELLRRLERTENQISALQAEKLKPMVPATPAEPSFSEAFHRRWERVRDPSITTVEQQTHSSSGGKSEPRKWYDRLSIRGYAQFRYNTVFDEEGAPAQHVGDRSIGENQSFIIRRTRVIISGDVSDRMYVYLQPDFASSVPGSPDANQFAQIRDWYGDLYLDTDKVYRFRVGQSKVPFGWENLQSSSNRLPLDRSDSLNSAVRNERDLGVFFYYTPQPVQDLFKEVLDDGLKGSGNYGFLGIGVHNGQGGSFVEQNDNLHVVARLAYPFRVVNNQIAEVGLQGYTGDYVVLSAQIRALGRGPLIRPMGTLEDRNTGGIRDERVAGTFIWYPKPFGFQTEWNVGNGPGLNNLQTEVVERSLNGGYAMVMYRHASQKCGTFFPFARYNHFRGGYKAERNAPYVEIDEFEAGVEWQINDQMELVTQYTVTDRTNTTALTMGESYQQFRGQLIRTQFQINY